jgi:hypothetical protein
MKRTAVVLASASALALAAVAAPAPAEARFGPALATYYGGYAPTYDPPTYYYISPYCGYHYPRIVRPAFAYYGGPGFWQHRWYRH